MNKLREWYEKTVTFFKEVKIEMKKVSWPNKEELRNYTIVVLFVVFIMSAYIGLIDKILGFFLGIFLRI
ncbi:preprotein translocase subunit SecE [Candidatus Sumerlaeota bacterium]|nr:preprotein translocase subunit SecE [Candidatus Sumerlaeota bacterium]